MHDDTPLSPARLALNRTAFDLLVGGLLAFARHWLGVVNGIFAAVSALAVGAPGLMSLGLFDAADLIYRLYATSCHQLVDRSYFAFGFQMAYCQRNFSIFLSLLMTGMAFGFLRGRGRTRGLSWRWYLLLISPMALDGFTQLFGWRESTWELRTITGALFGFATVWFLYPHIDRGMIELNQELATVERPH